MRPEVNNEKYREVLGLNKGDKILLTSGETCIFDRCKQKNFSGTIDGKRYSIFINSFDKLINKSDCNDIDDEDNFDNIIARSNKESEIRDLHKGDKVKLTNGEIAEFVTIKRTRFVALTDGKSYSIPFNMFVSVVSYANDIKVIETPVISVIDLKNAQMEKYQAVIDEYRKENINLKIEIKDLKDKNETLIKSTVDWYAKSSSK